MPDGMPEEMPDCRAGVRIGVKEARFTPLYECTPRVGVSPPYLPLLVSQSLPALSARERSPSCTAMNGMHDKRTSISQLLNPSSDSSSAYSHPAHLPPLPSSPGVPQYQHPQHPPHGPYPHQQDSGSSFHLRAASWEPVNDDPNAPKRRPDVGPPTGRSYPMPPQIYADMNGDMSQRQPRPRMDEHGNFVMPTGPWPPQPDVAGVPYASPIVAPMYSDERTCERESTFYAFVRVPEFKSILPSHVRRLCSKQSVSYHSDTHPPLNLSL